MLDLKELKKTSTLEVKSAEHGASSTLEIATAIGLSVSRTRDYLREMVKDKSIKSVGANRNRYYEL